MRKHSLLFLWIGLLFTLAGCWGGMTQIKDRAFVYLMAVDPAEEEGKVTVTVLTPVPVVLVEKKGAAEKPSTTFSADGRSIREALDNLQDHVAKELFYGHLSAVVFNGDLVRKHGLIWYLDFLERTQRINRELTVLITDQKAKDVIVYHSPLEALPGRFVTLMFESDVMVGKNVRTDLGRFEVEMAEEGRDSLLPMVTVREEQLTARDAAIFRDDKMVGKMRSDEIIGYQWVNNEVKKREIHVLCPHGDGGIIAYNVFTPSSKVKTEWRDGQVYVRVFVKTTGEITERTCNHKFTNDGLTKVEKLIEDKIKQEINRSVATAKKVKADIFGFGAIFRSKYPEIWEQIDWYEVFPEIPVEVQVEAIIRHTQGKY